MPEPTEYAPGTPSWIDIGATDVDALKTFYTSLFGWTAEDAGPPELTGGYGMFRLNGLDVAGYSAQQDPGPPRWSMYVTVEDADKTAAIATDAGGTVILEPMDVMDVGRMAVISDPQGAVFSIWQPRAHKGAGIVYEPATLGWTELNAIDLDGSRAFYSTVFGWTALTHEGEMQYTEFQLDGASIAGMMELPEQARAMGAPPHWLVYFRVSGCDDFVGKAKKLGANVLMQPMDIEPGRFSVLMDPLGAVFAVIQMNETAA